jgi:signal transduction histidine kinase
MMRTIGLIKRLKAFLTQVDKKKSLAFRVFGIFFVFILAMAIVLTLLFVHYQTEKVREDLNTKGRTIAVLLANSTRVGVFAENRELLNDAANGVMGQTEVISVGIYLPDGRELLKREAPSLKKVPPDRSVQFTEPVMLDQSQTNEEMLYYGPQPVKSERVVIGQVKVLLDASMVAQSGRSIVAQNFTIAAIFILVGSLCLALSLKRVLGPLSQLTDEVKLLGEGKAIEKISVASKDEIGRLATAFNVMAENLKQREEEARTLETRLRHAEKMEAVGTLARGIAHDFNNILTTVQASIYIMQKKIDKENISHNQFAGQISGHVSRMNNSISRAKDLVQSLLAFSRGQAVMLSPVEINSIIAGMGPMIRGLIGDDINYSAFVQDDPLIVLADSVQLERVVMNLASNARDAMPEGGTLSILVSQASSAEDHRISRLGRYAVISVADSGQGIVDEIKERIFEPFFTTKAVGKGMGLGLSIVYGIIEQHMGFIVAGSTPGGGAEFRIYLPLFEKTQ